MLGHSLGDLHDEIAGPWAERLHAAAATIRTHPDGYADLEPANGWGNVQGAADYLDRLAADCARHPKATIRICR